MRLIIEERNQIKGKTWENEDYLGGNSGQIEEKKVRNNCNELTKQNKLFVSWGLFVNFVPELR